MTLHIFGNQPKSVFGLRGSDENSATMAIGWLLERSTAFRKAFVYDLTGSKLSCEDAQIGLQRHDADRGFSDIEIVIASRCHLIVEAKRGWALPDQKQMERYAGRIANSTSAQAIVSISAADQRYASSRLPNNIRGLPVRHRAWSDIKALADAARVEAKSVEERLWLLHLSRHLEDFVTVQNPRDNMALVVALSAKPIRSDSSYTWIDVVENDGRYFDLLGNGKPRVPLNYIGFRYGGRVQSVHHVDDFAVVTNLAEVDPRWPTTDRDHFVYTLGPPMRPPNVLKGGKVQRGARAWCAIDTLLSGVCESLSDARDMTKRRLP